MRRLAFGVCALVVAAACTDMPSAPSDPFTPQPGFSVWSSPGHCYSTQVTVDVDDTGFLTTTEEQVAAAAADANGNGWVCLNLPESGDTPPAGSRTDYDDDFVTCPDGYSGEFQGSDADPTVDENGNGFVCVGSGGGEVDDVSSDAGQIGGGDLTMDDVECSEGYMPMEVTLELQAFDENDNGWICFRLSIPSFLYEDDLAEPMGPEGLTLTAGKVNGHGTYDAAGKTLSFSFHGSSDGTAVKGNFEFHDRTTGARWHGDVTCMEVDGGTALLEGVVTRNKDGGPAEGTAVAWMAVDNGEGRNAPDDQLSPPEALGLWAEACAVRPTEVALDIAGGNVQVR